MQPIVHGLEVRYKTCIQVQRLSILEDSSLKRRLRPFGTPEFFLLDLDGSVIYRWIGITTLAEFEAVVLPRCTAG